MVFSAFARCLTGLRAAAGHPYSPAPRLRAPAMTPVIRLPLHSASLPLLTAGVSLLLILACPQPVAGQQPPLDATAPLPTTAAAGRDVVAPGMRPNIPQAVSRPEAWPTGAARQATAGPKNVLSSIRENPGAPLEPLGPEVAVRQTLATEIDRALADRPAGPPADAGVTPASHELPVRTGADGLQTLDMATVVARIGPEVVLVADLMTPKALDHVAMETQRLGLSQDQIRELRLAICRSMLGGGNYIDTMLVYVDALREIPKDKIPEIRKNVDKSFDEHMLPRLMGEAGVATVTEYEHHLRAKGQSLERSRKTFFEQGLAQEWLRKNTNVSEEIPHADMIAYYENHIEDYKFPARVRFEALTVKVRPGRSRKQAWDRLAAMGNEVLAQRPFADVAREKSDGPTARDGGVFDWTSRGSLASKRLDEAVFSLPVGQLSAIVEDEPSLNLPDVQALHIVRVLERAEAGQKPFLEAQVAIKQALLEERRRKATDEYMAKLRERTPVWTIFDDEPDGRGPPGSGPQR